MRKNPLNYLGAPILSLQAMLAVLSKSGIGISTVIPDGLYGSETARAVTEFQRLHALPETGQTDHTTWNHIVDAFTRLSPLVLPAAPLEAVWQPMQTISAGEKNLQLHVIQGMLSALRHVFRKCRRCASPASTTPIPSAPSAGFSASPAFGTTACSRRSTGSISRGCTASPSATASCAQSNRVFARKKAQLSLGLRLKRLCDAVHIPALPLSGKPLVTHSPYLL